MENEDVPVATRRIDDRESVGTVVAEVIADIENTDRTTV